ncbi:MAG: hypothetical protein IK141_05090 [Clostridia bacterium]|nr:hypothetical protein [Clostridia bacterium]
MFRFRSQRYALVKYGSYALLMLGLFLLQSSRGTRLCLWGGVWNMTPFFVASVALLEGPYAGGGFGFAAGMLLAVNSTAPEGLSALLLSLFGILFGLFGAEYLRPVILSALSGGLICMTVQAVLRYLFYDLPVYRAGLAWALRQFAGELILALPAGALVWLIVRRLHRRFSEDVL